LIEDDLKPLRRNIMKQLKKLQNNTSFSNRWISICDIQYWKKINKKLDLVYSDYKDSLDLQYLFTEEGDE